MAQESKIVAGHRKLIGNGASMVHPLVLVTVICTVNAEMFHQKFLDLLPNVEFYTDPSS